METLGHYSQSPKKFRSVVWARFYDVYCLSCCSIDEMYITIHIRRKYFMCNFKFAVKSLQESDFWIEWSWGGVITVLLTICCVLGRSFYSGPFCKYLTSEGLDGLKIICSAFLVISVLNYKGLQNCVAIL